MLVSDVQQSSSLIYIHILFQILCPFRLLQNIVRSSLGLVFKTRSLAFYCGGFGGFFPSILIHWLISIFRIFCFYISQSLLFCSIEHTSHTHS